MNDIWTIWQNPVFSYPMIAFILAVLVTLYFEYKYLGERKKNQCLLKYIAKLTIAPLNPIRTIQKAADGTCQSGLTPIGIITRKSTKIPINKVTKAQNVLLIFIKRIINRSSKAVNQKGTIPLSHLVRSLIENEPIPLFYKRAPLVYYGNKLV